MKLLEYAAKMKAMNGTTDSNGMPSQGDQELNQRVMQNTMTAHHTGDGIGLDGFKEPSIEQLVDLIESGKADKSILGEDADRIINDVNTRRNFKLPGEYPGTVEEFDNYYKYNTETAPNRKPPTVVAPIPSDFIMPIPVKPYEPEKRDTREEFVPDEDDLAFLKNFTKSMKA